jgi:pimeloyl-ACP methyl ester carboxylesterase
MVEQGAGPALVLVPGLPGPWQFITPLIDALASRFRVLTLSLGPECTLDADVARIADALDRGRVNRAVICGISFGGLVALRFAAAYPQRTAALVLVSTPGPGVRLRPRQRTFARWPHLLLPFFLFDLPRHLRRELRRALPDRRERFAFQWRQVCTGFETRPDFGRAAKRARLIEQLDIAADAKRVTSPTLVVTGEPDLDSVVPAGGTVAFLDLIPNARHIVIRDTGHLGSITRPAELAGLVHQFAGPTVQTDVA